MSRSYKHTPYCGDTKDKFFKKQANRRLRRKKLTHDLQHKSYKKDYCSWNICDYYWIETKNFDKYYKSCVSRWLNERYKDYPYPTKEECLEEYRKWYIRK